jgi:Tol biopolymer transport system component/predicted Ser/Thr protein kinase
MDLIGKTLRNYQIMEELGRGGMAVVYKAYQPSLNRYVALKVLPPQLGFDQEFVERFQREARAAAGLGHPNIVVVFDVGQEEGVHYIVMEYLEGRTLKEVIEQESPMPPKRVQGIVSQIGAALDYAHRRGFIHRDVKPANIFVGEGDRVTLTDFGIAKAASEAQQLTRTGILMGTPEYMSPEQASGSKVDHRTDLYALGVVLYQMVVGQAPFRGTTPHATLHAVIYEAPPPPRELNPSVTPALESVVMKAVAKQPGARFQTGAEMTSALQAALSGRGAVAAVPPPSGRPARPETVAARQEAQPSRKGSPVIWILVAIAAVLVLVLGGLFLLLGGNGDSGTSLPNETEGVVWQTPTPVPTLESGGTAVGPTVTVPAPTDTEPVPTVAPPTPEDTPAAPSHTAAPPGDTPVPPTETPIPPTDTPIPPTDTPVPPTKPAPEAQFGRLAFSSDRQGAPEIFAISLPGGSPVRLTNNGANDWLPDWSPDGSRIAFTSNRTGSYDIWAMGGNGGSQQAIVTTGAWDEYGRWAPDGQRISFSSTAKTDGVDNSEIFVRQANGNLERLTYSRAENQWADWSPNGRIVFTEGFKDDSNWDIFVMNGNGSNRTLWLGGPTCDVQPTWSPDGQSIAFLRIARDTNGNGRIDYEDMGDVWVGAASGGGLRQLTSGMWATTPAWSPDSKWIAFARMRDSNGNGRSDAKDAADIWAVPFGGGEPVPLLQSPYRDGDPSWTW